MALPIQNATFPVTTPEEPLKQMPVDDEEGEKMWESNGSTATSPEDAVLLGMPDATRAPAESFTDVERPDTLRIAEEQAAVEADEAADAAIDATQPSLESAVALEQAQANKDPLLVEVESVISEGMDELYVNLPMEKRAAFKETGEMLAKTVAGYLKKGKLPRVKVLKAVRWWVRMIPQTNIHFLEQKAKILLDGIIKMTEQEAG